MKSIVSLREIEDRPSSNVRFYCDNDGVKRWRPMSDLDAEIIEPNGVPNSKRKRRQGKILQDLLNGNVMKTRGCDLYGNSIAGFSYSVTDGKGAMLDQERMNWQLEKLPWLIENFKDQPSLRATISVSVLYPPLLSLPSTYGARKSVMDGQFKDSPIFCQLASFPLCLLVYYSRESTH